jgi:predicted ribosome quality control (RQC) complex YloA/Tae2 family protein
MSLSARELEALVAELQPLVGARVDAVRVHAERALTLELHGRGREALLLLSAEPDATRLHAAADRPPQPETPFGWQGLLRKELEGARLAALELVPGDRVVALAFERAAGPVRLVGELTGRHGNLFLVGADGLIRASAGRNLSTRRELVAGRPWVAPAAPPPRPGDEAAEPARPPRFAPEPDAPWPLSAAVERHYAAVEAARRLAEARRRLREPLRAAAARARRALEKLAEEAARVPAAEEDRRLGDLLKANLHAVRRGAREVELTEWTAEGPRPVRLGLDPALGPRENMERYYHRFRRIAESAARVAARAAEVRARAEAVAALAAEVERAPAEALPRLEKEARRLGAGPRPAAAPRRRHAAPPPPYRAFRSLAGLAILVGRGAAENDELTRRVARGNDLWLHARGRAGAHVVVRLGKAPADQETLLDAAHLALHFSDARGEPQAEVASTRVKYVKKPKGAAPGAVTYSQEKVLLLRVEPRRLERLLAEEEAAEA